MELIVPNGPNSAEINFSWLPTWLGLNQPLLSTMDARLQEAFAGHAMSPEILLAMHSKLIDLLVEEFPNIKGLDKMLHAIKHVHIES